MVESHKPRKIEILVGFEDAWITNQNSIWAMTSQICPQWHPGVITNKF